MHFDCIDNYGLPKSIIEKMFKMVKWSSPLDNSNVSKWFSLWVDIIRFNETNFSIGTSNRTFIMLHHFFQNNKIKDYEFPSVLTTSSYQYGKLEWSNSQNQNYR